MSSTLLPVFDGTNLNLGGDSPMRVDHIGIAVRSIEAARRFYETLGLRIGSIETIQHEGVRVAMISVGSSRFELLEPLTPGSVVGRFLEKHGEGLHHIAINVDDIGVKFNELLAKDITLTSNTIRIGAGGHRYFFVHPSSTGGVLVEIVATAQSESA